MEKHVLSKSTFIRGVQCLKSLYLNKKRPFLRDRLPKERLLVFRRGHRVGELAQELFPGGVNLSPGHPAAYRKALTSTSEKISEGYPVLYEAAFQHAGVLIFLDILVHTGSGWHAYEVKSSAGISDTYLMDAALQHYVIQGSGIELRDISLIHIDREYVKQGDIDPKGLFKIVNVTEEALSRQDYVKEQIKLEKETLKLNQSPEIAVGEHCREPYDCDFIGHCWKNEPVPMEKEAGDHFKREALNAITKSDGNMAFIKLLTMRLAIPLYDGTAPYQEIPYAYSLSVGEEHFQEIFGHESNPGPEVASALINDLTGIDTLVTYGHGKLLSKMLGEDMLIIDLLDSVLPDSELRNIKDGDSLLDKICSLTGTGKPESVFTSDAVCTHYYFEDSNSTGVRAPIEKYAMEWTEGIKRLYGFLQT